MSETAELVRIQGRMLADCFITDEPAFCYPYVYKGYGEDEKDMLVYISEEGGNRIKQMNRIKIVDYKDVTVPEWLDENYPNRDSDYK